tara:strand:+ start:919 stop:1689 length:771 start_codon:yes stop_codon:yes gene_type:complete
MKELEQSKKLLCIDADIPCYSIGWGCEKEVDEDKVHRRVDDFFSKLFATHETFNYKAFLTGKGNFRETMAVSHKYKGTRKKDKPKWYNSIKQYLIQEWDCIVVEGMEADDQLAIELTNDTNAICCTIDKDLLQVEGWHYGWGTHNKAERELHYVDWWGKLELRGKKLYGEGVMWLYAQAIMGDSTDNIKGIHGAADKKAFELLQDKTTEIELYDTVLELYTQHFDSPEERLEENMHLLYMCRGWGDDKLIHWKKPI